MDEASQNPPCEESAPDQLQAEVEHLRQHLSERDNHIACLEGEFLQCSVKVNDLHDQVDTWREKYERLYDSYKRVQKLNQVLEDKLLQMVDKMKGEKSQLTKDIATLSVRLAESKHNYSMLQKENERYKNDMNLAIQLLQCKPDNFVSHKLDNLPVDTQARVSQYVMSKTPKSSATSRSGNNGNEPDTFDASEYEFNISASLMTKILTDSVQDSVTKHCDTCSCSKLQNKPFCYNDSYYSVATQTNVSGEMRNSLCLSCNSEIKSIKSVNSNFSCSASPSVKVISEQSVNIGLTGPLYIVPHPTDPPKDNVGKETKTDINDKIVKDEKKVEVPNPKEMPTIVDEDFKPHRINSSTVNTEPAVHHKLCDRTIPSLSSNISSHSINDGKDNLLKDIPKEIKSISEAGDTNTRRKNSQSSMGAISRTSSLAKSTVSTHKSNSNTAVGPGPRFCNVRLQAGSKNILLDNAEPDVPPVLYRRQSKCNENSLLKDLNGGIDNFIDLRKPEESLDTKEAKEESVVVESTLIDVHVDSNKEAEVMTPTAPINPVIMNVSSSPLQPLKTHNFSNASENSIMHQSVASQNKKQPDVVDDLLNDFRVATNIENNNQIEDESPKTPDILTPIENDVKIFNFDQYEQSKLSTQMRPLRTIGMTQLHSIANTRISKDPQALPKIEKRESSKGILPAVVNVYPNMTQTHLKTNEKKKAFTNEPSTSSLSSDDSAAILQKQQLLRVAEWVEKNLEQQNNFNDPLEDEVNFSARARRDSKINRLTETLNELALNMPHPVSKYSKLYIRDHNNWVHNPSKQDKTKPRVTMTNIAKETLFPVESDDVTVTETMGSGEKATARANDVDKFDIDQELRDAFRANGDKEITPEDLARMEYNVKKFLLSGPHWANPDVVGRSRRTSSKTETDV